MRYSPTDLAGVWVPLVTPFAGGAPDLGRLRALVDWLLDKRIRGVLALGTTGEAPHLSDVEAERVVEAVVKAVAGRVPVMAGSGRPSTRETLRITTRFAELGVDAALILTPFYYRTQMSPEALPGFYSDIADRTAVPLFVYHIPQVTDLDLKPERLAQILQHPNIWGFKDSSTEGVLLVEETMRGGGRAFVGNAAGFLPGLQAGAAGGILAVAHLLPELCVKLYEGWLAGDLGQASILQGHASALTAALKGWGIGGVKWGLEVRGEPVGAPCAPLRTPPEETRRQIETAIRQALEVSG